MRSKILITIAAVVVIIVGIGVGVGLLAGRGPGHAQTPPPDIATATPQPVTIAKTHPMPAPQNTHVDVQPVIPNESTPVAQITNLALAATNTTLTETNWEEKIDDIVGGDEPDTNKVKQLFAIFPKLPPDGQEEAAQHLSNLVDDDDYSQLGDLLKNDKLPEGVLDELLADVLNRPNTVKLPALLEVASDANHAKRDEAKDLLELYLGEDYGTDWNAWKEHMNTWMKENPE